MSKRRIIIIFAVIIALIIAAIPIAKYIDGRIDAERVKGQNINVVINGKEYIAKNCTNFLLMGVDKYDNSAEKEGYRNNEQADFIAVVSVNSMDETYSILMLNRDSMVDMPELGVTGETTGTILHQQLALAHTYGVGAEDSCKNTVNVVSSLLHDLKIDHYVELTMDAIATINDMVGGVPVIMPKDYTYLDPEFVLGDKVTLKGEQALTFIRARMKADDGTNIARMERQRTYICSFLDQLAVTEVDDNFLSEAYNKLNDKDTMLTDCTVQAIKSFMKNIKDYSLLGLYQPEGNAHVGEEFMEFDIDQTSLDTLVTSLYYDEKK